DGTRGSAASAKRRARGCASRSRSWCCSRSRSPSSGRSGTKFNTSSVFDRRRSWVRRFALNVRGLSPRTPVPWSRGLERLLGSSEWAPGGLLPRLAAAHRTGRQLADDRHAVPAVRTVELALDWLTRGPELDVVAVRPPSRVDALRHPQ